MGVEFDNNTDPDFGTFHCTLGCLLGEEIHAGKMMLNSYCWLWNFLFVLFSFIGRNCRGSNEKTP